MSEKITLDIDTTEGERKLDALNDKIEDTEDKLTDMAENVEEQTEKSFNEVMGMMRASYMIISGVSQAVGGNMSQIFSSIYGVAVSAIGTYQAIAAAMAASGVGAPQAIIMSISLATAIAGLVATMTKQTELGQRIRGLNMALHGISSLIGDAYYL